MNIVLVHGIFDNGRLFKGLVEKLSALGHRCYVPSLKPIDARLGIADLSEKLRDFIGQAIGSCEEFVLIGFSMGCLVSRHYLQALNGVERCKAFFAVSGPLEGSRLAHLYFGRGAVDMRPGSEFIQSLRDSESSLEKIQLFTYRTPFDLMIVPSRSSHWAIAQNYVTKAMLHRFMLKDKFVCDHICRSLETIAS